MLLNVIAPYIVCGTIFGFGFELLVNKMGEEDRRPTQWWERLFWITCWPYCLIIFLWNMFGK